MHTLSRLAKPLLSRQHISMPAKNLYREYKEGIYSHIYNKGVEDRLIFNDDTDYEVFIGYLKDYLTAPKAPESIKKSFKVHGRVFRGTPHQPKNYFNKVELIAYSLMPDHFHLILYQKVSGSLENFMRSLCTRYSMYFNKKYQHQGALFQGPYKSVQIKDDARLVHSTHFLHHNHGNSSYPEYLGQKETSWVKPKTILAFFDNGTNSYKNFIEKYTLNQKEKELIEDIIFESETQHLERREPDLERRKPVGNVKNTPEVSTESSEKTDSRENLKAWQRIPEIVITAIVFLALVAIGVRNIGFPTQEILGSSVAQTATITATPTPQPLAKEEKNPPTMLVIRIEDAPAFAFVNIREKPTVNSEKIDKAKDGDNFEFVSVDSGWYGVKLATGSTGFISAEYVVKEEINK